MPRNRRKAPWRELPPSDMAAHLLATPTISDGAWTSEPRLPRDARWDIRAPSPGRDARYGQLDLRLKRRTRRMRAQVPTGHLVDRVDVRHRA